MGRLRAPHFQADPRVTLVAVVDSWRAGGERLAAQYPGARYFPGLAVAIESANSLVNAVWICTPTDAHEQAIALAAAAGLPVFTEKPVAEDAASIARIYGLARDAGVALCCGFQRRFDRSYVACANSVFRGAVGKPTMVSVFFGDHPVPPLEFLKNGGCPFMDLSPHDVDYVRWVLGEEPVEVFASGCSSTPELAVAQVLDNAFMFVKFSRGTMVTLQMSRGATYGYDQRCEFFGDLGRAGVGNQLKTSDTLADAAGCHAATLKHSFPQRFAQAFAAEVAAFAQVVLDGAVWPVTERDCVIVQTIAQCAAQSQKEGRKITIQLPSEYAGNAAAPTSVLPAHRVRGIGAGSFGQYIRQLVTADTPSSRLTWLPGASYTRSSGLDWDADLLSPSGPVDAVYVASPDAFHFAHALACLNAGKHTLVEKPVVGDPGFQALVDATHDGASNKRTALVVGFQRRFDPEFLRAKAFVEGKASGRPGSVAIESRDPVPAVDDMAFVFNNSCCHDIDMLNWLLPDAVKLIWETASRSSAGSVVEMAGKAVFADGGETVVSISYCKEHPSYVQRVTVDGQCFGYDFKPAEGQMECEIYAGAYKAQWKFFAGCCDAAAGLVIAGSRLTPVETPSETSHRLASYVKTFAWLKQAQFAF